MTITAPSKRALRAYIRSMRTTGNAPATEISFCLRVDHNILWYEATTHPTPLLTLLGDSAIMNVDAVDNRVPEIRAFLISCFPATFPICMMSTPQFRKFITENNTYITK